MHVIFHQRRESKRINKMADAEREQMTFLKQLIENKTNIENEIRSFQEVLRSQNVGMDDTLVDRDGYPRSDIDVHAVRIARNKIICLGNDLNSIMKDIESGLHKAHAIARQNKNSATEEQMDTTEDDVNLKPFLKVDLVSQNSPAERAGLQVNDLILKFGTIREENFSGLQSVGWLVQHSKGRPLPITVKRQGMVRHVTLTPSTWSGQGLLGLTLTNPYALLRWIRTTVVVFFAYCAGKALLCCNVVSIK